VLLTADSAGDGNRFRVVTGSRVTNATDSISFPSVAIVSTIRGCDDNLGAGSTHDCSTAGGDVVTITGLYFNGAPAVLIGSAPCAAPVVSGGNTVITCTTPAGVGLDLPVTISLDNQFSLPRYLLSYKLPAVTTITGCLGTGSTDLSLGGCARNGTSLITITVT
jgi:hypothetical protein